MTRSLAGYRRAWPSVTARPVELARSPRAGGLGPAAGLLGRDEVLEVAAGGHPRHPDLVGDRPRGGRRIGIDERAPDPLQGRLAESLRQPAARQGAGIAELVDLLLG